MLLYYLFWMLMGLFIHFYIIFGTNLLTQGPTRIAVFCLFQCFQKRNIKENETFRSDLFGTNANLQTWSGCQATNEAATRVPGAPCKCERVPTLVGPSSVHRPTSSSYIYPHTLKTSEATTKNYFHCRNLLYP